VALELVTLEDGVRYGNTAASAAYLIKGAPQYLGAFARILTGPGDGGMKQWAMLPTALRSGQPVAGETIVQSDSPFWPELVKALTPLSCEVASIAAKLLDLATDRALSVLDVGGGAGAYALTWLPLNPQLRLTQLDWSAVNALARESVAARGLSERFFTLDGDLHEVPFGTGRYDVVVLSNICHHESASSNLVLLRKIAHALVPGGRVVISDFVLDDERKGPVFASRFGVGMVLQTPEGASYRESDYQGWLSEASFEPAQVDRSHELSTLLIASKR
jgi:SAM-dependent methyltransferase